MVGRFFKLLYGGEPVAFRSALSSEQAIASLGAVALFLVMVLHIASGKSMAQGDRKYLSDIISKALA